jgi:hypothetical protein
LASIRSAAASASVSTCREWVKVPGAFSNSRIIKGVLGSEISSSIMCVRMFKAPSRMGSKTITSISESIPLQSPSTPSHNVSEKLPSPIRLTAEVTAAMTTDMVKPAISKPWRESALAVA